MFPSTKPTHHGVNCDECHTQPIKGTRYKCGNCANYDLCSICFEYTTHNRDHAFIVIKRPLTSEQSFTDLPLLKNTLYKSHENPNNNTISFGQELQLCNSFAPKLDNASGPLRDRLIDTEYNRQPNPFASTLFGINTPKSPVFSAQPPVFGVQPRTDEAPSIVVPKATFSF